jgi:hypothetical protein
MSVALLGNITADDDFMHAIEPVENFSESALFHYTGRDTNGGLIGGLIRVANRPNQGYAECTVLVLLPDGSGLFNFERPKITGNRDWRVAAWNIEVLEPGGELFRTRYDGPVLNLADPRIMANPKLGFQQPRVTLKFDLRHKGKSPMSEFRHMRPWVSDTGEQFAHHRPWISTSGLHQLMKSFGTLEIEGRGTYQIDGFGWRDHNWGPRNWQGFTRHEFLTGNFGNDEGFCLYSTVDGHGHGYHRGDQVLLKITALEIQTECAPGTTEVIRLRADFALENGERHVLTGKQKGHIPLRNRRAGIVTQIGYSIWDYVLDGKRTGAGLGEFLWQERADE